MAGMSVYSAIYWGHIGIMEKGNGNCYRVTQGDLLVFWGHIKTMEKRMESTIKGCVDYFSSAAMASTRWIDRILMT